VRVIYLVLSFLLLFFLWTALISFLWREPLLLTAILSFISLLGLSLSNRRDNFLWFLVAAVFGPIGEAIVSSSGLWTYYGDALVFGVPCWLPLAWGITAVFLRKYIAFFTEALKDKDE
jgi:hypothetical protein